MLYPAQPPSQAPGHQPAPLPLPLPSPPLPRALFGSKHQAQMRVVRLTGRRGLALATAPDLLLPAREHKQPT